MTIGRTLDSSGHTVRQDSGRDQRHRPAAGRSSLAAPETDQMSLPFPGGRRLPHPRQNPPNGIRSHPSMPKNRRLFRLCPAILFSFSVRLLPSGIDPVLLPVPHQRNGSGQRVQQAGRRSEARLRPVLQGSEHLLLPDRLQLDRGPMW